MTTTDDRAAEVDRINLSQAAFESAGREISDIIEGLRDERDVLEREVRLLEGDKRWLQAENVDLKRQLAWERS